ncbi:ferric-chelate reductase [Stagonosporopsis vannaccii]|nr:ferric-chelate reductase [Stagonosporopsis vannaccii]
MMPVTYTCLVSIFVTLVFHTPTVIADGTGLIGFGKTLYHPTCPFACRNVIRRQPLACTPTDSHENHGTAHNPVTTPPKCFVQDPTFLKTMALCIDTYCSLSDKPAPSLIEDYWASHLGTGTLGNYDYVPVLSYNDALLAAREDEERARDMNTTVSTPASIPKGLVPFKVSSPLAITTGGSAALNSTRLVGPVQWQLQYNYLSNFETNEKGHSTMTIVIAIVAIFLPVVLSSLRFLPGLTSNVTWSRLMSVMVYPATFGKHHRQPVAEGLVPTRGQSLYVLLILALNIILLVAPITITQPQASFTTRGRQLLSVIGNRAGTMAMGNTVALFLFSSRNSALLYLTDWSYSTYLLLHRWLGYCAVAHTVIHSAMLWRYYLIQGTYPAEILRLYWQWGIVGTVAVCALIPFSLLVIRQKLYEFFIASHVVLSLLFLVGYYYHIWYVYTYNWGYEIWMFVAAGIWASERLLRVIRIALNGSNTAVVTVITDTDDEYVRIDLQGKRLQDGVAYLCFPTLSRRFWETHPFSVSGAMTEAQPSHTTSPSSRSNSSSDPVSEMTAEKDGAQHTTVPTMMNGNALQYEGPTTTFFARARGGITRTLKERASKSETKRIRIRVLVDGPYSHSGQMQPQIARCNSILCIAGGVGITACLPLLTQFGAKDTRLVWSSRHSGLVAELKPTLDALASHVKVETLVRQRFDLVSVIRQELIDGNNTGKGTLAIVVSGPPGMADDVRCAVTRLALKHKQARPYVLVDEAFSW